MTKTVPVASSVALLMLAALACGEVSGPEKEPSSTPPAVPSGTAPAATTPSSSPPSQPSAPVPSKVLCGAQSHSVDVLAWADGHDLYFVHGDGSKHSVHTFSIQPLQGETELTFNVVARGGFVAATAGGGDGEAILLNDQGKVIWQSVTKGSWLQEPQLNDAGWLVLRHALADGSGTAVVVSSDGTERSVPSISPIGHAFADGQFPAFDEKQEGSAAYSWRHLDGSVAPLAHPADDQPSLSRDDIVYMTSDTPKTQLVTERPGKATTLAVGGDSPSLASVTRSGWALVFTSVGNLSAGYTLVDTTTQAATPISLPSGERSFGMRTFYGPALTESGEIVIPLRDDHTASLFRTDAASKGTWTKIGPTFAGITTMSAAANGGTYVVETSTENGFFQSDPWPAAGPTDPKAERTGAATVIVRPAKNVARDLDAIVTGFAPDALTLSDDGLCIAYVGGGSADAGANVGGTLRLLEVENGGAPIDVGTLSGASASAASSLAWMR